MHTVIPEENVLRLVQHGVNFLFAERDRPRQRGQRIAADIQRQQPPEFHGDRAAEIPVHHAGGKGRGLLRAPDNAVEFLPRVAEIVTVKINDPQRTAAVDLLNGLFKTFRNCDMGVVLRFW